MVSMERQMADMPELETTEAEGNIGRSLAWITVAAIGMIFTAGAIVGVIAAATEDGQALSLKAFAIIGALVAIIGALIYFCFALVPIFIAYAALVAFPDLAKLAAAR